VGEGVSEDDARRPGSAQTAGDARPAVPPPAPGRRALCFRIPDVENPPDGGRRTVAAGGRAFVIVRSGDDRFACEDRCLHAGVRLSAAIQRDTVLECRWHHWKYDLRSGRVEAEDSPLESFTTYPVRVDGDHLVVDLTPRTRIRRKPWDLDEPEQGRGAT
jgi:nitrite reductase/ring-hydroxylating ferredoxin subunit